jgi:GntR family transcriptional regulator / MocR family aminotransferase
MPRGENQPSTCTGFRAALVTRLNAVTTRQQMQLKLDKSGTRYHQIARAIRQAVLDGRIAAESRLPSASVLAAELSVSRPCVQRAYRRLCAEGFAVARPRFGTRVTKMMPPAKISAKAHSSPLSHYAARSRSLPLIAPLGARASARPTFDLLYGEPLLQPETFLSWRRTLSAAAFRAGTAHPSTEGFLPLRRALACHLTRRRGLICDASDILVVGGTQQALTLVARVLLNSGDRVVVEDPCYQLAIHSLLAHGAAVTSCRIDHEGLVVSEMPRRRIRLAYVAPAHQFPSGVVMTLARRLQLLHWAAQTGSWIFEDEYDAEFHSGDKPLPALRTLDLSDRIIYVGNFSKTLFPSLRLGYIVCPKAIRDDLFRAKLLDDLGSAATEQAALGAFINSGRYEKHLRKSSEKLASRRRAIVKGLQGLEGRHIEIGPHQVGMHFVIWFLCLGFDRLDAFIERARSLGLGLHPIHPYYRSPPGRPGLLIGYAGLSVGQLRTAVELFARCMDSE